MNGVRKTRVCMSRVKKRVCIARVKSDDIYRIIRESNAIIKNIRKTDIFFIILRFFFSVSHILYKYFV